MRNHIACISFLGLLACSGADDSGDPDDTNGNGDDTPQVGDDEVAGTTVIDGVETSWGCELGVDPGSLGAYDIAGDTRRFRVACVELTGNIGQNMFSVLEEREEDFVVGTSDMTHDYGDGSFLAVVHTDENGDGFQTHYDDQTPGWTGELVLDEVGAAGGGVVRGSLTGSWQTMEEMADGGPTGVVVERPGTLSVAFSFTRP